MTQISQIPLELLKFTVSFGDPDIFSKCYADVSDNHCLFHHLWAIIYSFSKPRLIVNCLKSMIGKSRLNNLAMLSIEWDIDV